MKKSILAFLLFLIPISAMAANVELSWTPPTERESCDVKAADGTCTTFTPLPPSEIGGYRIYYGTTQGAYNLGPVEVDDPAAVSTIVDWPAGAVYFAVITTFDTDLRESLYSEFISVAVDHGLPKPPARFRARVIPD